MLFDWKVGSKSVMQVCADTAEEARVKFSKWIGRGLIDPSGHAELVPGQDKPKQMSYMDMCFHMQNRKEVKIGELQGVINAIEAEDGSGKCWNVTVQTSSGAHKVFVRTH